MKKKSAPVLSIQRAVPAGQEPGLHLVNAFDVDDMASVKLEKLRAVNTP